MKRSECLEEQIVYVLRQAEAGTPIGDVCRRLGIAEQTLYAWKKKYAHLGVSELCRLRQLEVENNLLKRLVADLSLDKYNTYGGAAKKVYGPPAAGTCPLVSWDVSGELCAGLSPRPVQTRLVVSKESGQGSSRHCGCTFTIWLRPGRGSGTCGSGCCSGARAG